MINSDKVIEDLVLLSRWIDEYGPNKARDPEAQAWGRISKIMEEAGEAVSEYIAFTGQNPRKGHSGNMQAVIKELLDTAVTALGAVEHLTENKGVSIPLFENHLSNLVLRAQINRSKFIQIGTERPSDREGFKQVWVGDSWIYTCEVCGDEASYCDGSRHNTDKDK